MSFPTFWTEDRCIEAIALRRDGHSSRTIAGMIGAPSRYSVIGIMHRLKARGYDVPVSKYYEIKKDAGEAPKRPRGEPWKPPVAVADQGRVAPLIVKRPAPVVSEPNPTSLWNLKPRQCRFPLWAAHERLPIAEKMYCGAASGEHSYCAAHHAVCTSYLPASPGYAIRAARK